MEALQFSNMHRKKPCRKLAKKYNFGWNYNRFKVQSNNNIFKIYDPSHIYKELNLLLYIFINFREF
jgi:hypothetical protein